MMKAAMLAARTGVSYKNQRRSGRNEIGDAR
jgi:hypothetical protein